MSSKFEKSTLKVSWLSIGSKELFEVWDMPEMNQDQVNPLTPEFSSNPLLVIMYMNKKVSNNFHLRVK